jgi:K+-sensing histidine kinase KdpD
MTVVIDPADQSGKEEPLMVLVCVTDQESCGRLIETGRKLADMAELPLKVISVRPHRMESWFGSEELEYLFHLSKQLYAEMIIIFHDYAVEAVADYIRNHEVSYIIVGMPPDPGQSIFISGLEDQFPQIPIVSLDKSGMLQLVPIYDEHCQPA